MAESRDVLYGLSLALLSDWITTFSFVFGGCCSNAVTLERVTSEYPYSGTLITFFQFIVISLQGLPNFVTFKRGPLGIPFPRLKPRRLPLTPYLIQVGLFYFISLLNNAAFAYNIPMPVHIIFRSGGLVISMLMGWLISGKKYTLTQITSVLVVTLGVVLTTLSASLRNGSASAKAQLSQGPPLTVYLTGIAILVLALVLSGFLGIVQDKTYSSYGKQLAKTKTEESDARTTEKGANAKADNRPDVWQESMFYLHFLSLPMFVFVRHDLTTQMRTILSDRSLLVSLPAPLAPLVSKTLSNSARSPFPLAIPAALPPLLLNTLTQLVCVAGVNRLTTRVAALTVTLVLVVRKAVSLVLSVLLFDGAARMDAQASALLWGGAAMVFAGTVGYTMSGKKKPPATQGEKEE
ncbi:UAA transporter [Artomyces pyxidatus]|uniref:UAA transporter n=1 Tax=Artomyces pyxidatus TaxID=48021 RepID=A0ACB8TLD5_9AGAM|nr:UAA transporter [Artomyces pyxidatus]